MKFITFLLCLFVSNISWAAAYTSSGSGDWSNVATWGGGGFPGVGDTATIQAGHTVTIDGDISVGTSPGGDYTYDLDISGKLYWPSNPAGDWTFTVYSSVRVNAGGSIEIGESPGELNCANTGIWEFANAAAGRKYMLYLNGGTFTVYGCENFDTSSGTVHRARIASCTPDCTSGAGKTIKLDRDVNWNASSGWDGDRILIGIGGSDSTAPAAGDDPEEITSWTAPSVSQIATITFTENHQIGDMVVNASRNFIMRSDSATQHSRIYTTAADDLFDLNWLILDEMGDSTSSPALMFNSNSKTLGTLNYVAALNCEDGSSVTCFYLNSKDWTKIEGLVAFDYRGGSGIYFVTTLDIGRSIVKDITTFEGPNGLGVGFSTNGSQKNVLLDGLWSSHGASGISSASSYLSVTNSILHGNTSYCASTTSPSGYMQNMTAEIANNEVRNCTESGWIIRNISAFVHGNDFDLCGDFCMYIYPGATASNIYSDGNTYDNCNTDNSILQGALGVYSTTFFYHGNNEEFGQTNPNFRANIFWRGNDYITGSGYSRGVCNECLFADPTNVVACGSMPSDGIFLYGCAIGWGYAAYIPDETYFTLHNKDGVEYAEYGWGPGGAVISRDTAINYTTSNIKMKITPAASNKYSYITAGSFYVAAGTAVTVDLYLRKDEAVATEGWRPRLALQGCGFELYTDYDEMSDVNNTWEKVTVSGVSSWRGVVHIYVAVRGKLSGANLYTPVWPPTLDVYADGLSVTK